MSRCPPLPPRSFPDVRVPREVALDINTEPSQSEQIVWDDPTAREERAKLADNLQWPGSPSQYSEPFAPPPPSAEDGPQFRDSMTDSELVEMGKRSIKVFTKWRFKSKYNPINMFLR